MKTRLDRSSAVDRLRKHLSRTEAGQVPESERSTLPHSRYQCSWSHKWSGQSQNGAVVG
jgi:hypothetical protein